MSDNGLGDDLFGGSDDGAPPQPPSPIASSSKVSPKQSAATTPPADEDDDGGIGADLVSTNPQATMGTQNTGSMLILTVRR